MGYTLVDDNQFIFIALGDIMENTEYFNTCAICAKEGNRFSILYGNEGDDFVTCEIHGNFKVSDLFPLARKKDNG